MVERDLVCSIFALFLRATVFIHDGGIPVRAYRHKRRYQPIPRSFGSYHDLGVCDGHSKELRAQAKISKIKRCIY